ERDVRASRLTRFLGQADDDVVAALRLELLALDLVRAVGNVITLEAVGPALLDLFPGHHAADRRADADRALLGADGEQLAHQLRAGARLRLAVLELADRGVRQDDDPERLERRGLRDVLVVAHEGV